MWLIGAAMVCLLAAPLVQLSVSAGNGWPHNALRHHWLMPVSCHFRDCKSAAGHEFDSCKRGYNKCPDLYLYLLSTLYLSRPTCFPLRCARRLKWSAPSTSLVQGFFSGPDQHRTRDLIHKSTNVPRIDRGTCCCYRLRSRAR